MRLNYALNSVRSLQAFQVLRFGALIGTNILLAKSALALEAIGIYETLLFIGTGITFFWVSGFLRGLLASFPSLNKRDQGTLFFNVFLLFVLLGGSVAIVFTLFEQQVVPTLTDYDHLPYFRLLCLYLAINAPTFLVEYIYLLQNRPKWILGFGIFSFGGHVFAVIIPIWLGYTLAGSFMALIALGILKFLWLLWLLLQYGRFQINTKVLYPFLWLSLPLILNTLVAGAAEYIDGLIILKYFDKETFAIFRYGARELPLTTALTTAFSAATIPKIAESLEAGLSLIKKESRGLMHVLFGLSIVLMLLSPCLFPLVFREEFSSSALIFNIYLLILVSRVIFPQTILIGLKKTHVILWLSLIELSINVGLSLLLVDAFGLVGIAAATVVAFISYKLMLVMYVRRHLGIALKRYLDFRWYLGYTALLFSAFLLSLALV